MRKTWNLAWRHVGLYEAVQRCSLWCDEWGLFYCSLCFMHTMCAIAAILLWEVDTSWNYLKLFKCEVLIVNCFIPLRFMQHLKSLDDTIVLYCSATWEHNQFYKKKWHMWTHAMVGAVISLSIFFVNCYWYWLILLFVTCNSQALLQLNYLL